MELPVNISEELKFLGSKLPEKAPENGYTVPEGYFLNFPLTVLGKISSEAFTASGPSVPEGYFEGLPAQILAAIHKNSIESTTEEEEALPPILVKAGKKMPYSLPEGYFENFSGNIPLLNKEEITPELLSSLRNKPTYRVPEEYFQQFPAEVLRKTGRKQEGKIIKMGASYWKKFAAAAVIIGLVITGAIYLTDNSANNIPPATMVSSLDSFSADELGDYLEGHSVAVNLIENGSSIINEEFDLQEDDFEVLFTNLSDQDLQGYISEYLGIQDAMVN